MYYESTGWSKTVNSVPKYGSSYLLSGFGICSSSSVICLEVVNIQFYDDRWICNEVAAIWLVCVSVANVLESLINST